MAPSHEPPRRDPKDAAEARQWVEETRRRAEAGELTDDIPDLQRKLAEEKRKRKRR